MNNNGLIVELWMDNEAEEAARFYVNVFENAELGEINYYNAETPSNKPIGSIITVDFSIAGQRFQTLNGGPFFKVNPSISFIVNFDPKNDVNAGDSRSKLDQLWGKLSEGGKVLMPLGEYPFSKWYGWIQDKYGVSWQLILTNPEGEARPVIVPSLLFAGDNNGKAEEASNFYISVFKDSARGTLTRYPAGMEPDKEGNIMFTDFKILNTWVVAMDSGRQHDFNFTEGVSFVVECEDQAEVDYYWEKLSAVPEAEACGWCKDKYGVSWQIVPKQINELIYQEDKEKGKRAMEALLDMKKIDITALITATEK